MVKIEKSQIIRGMSNKDYHGHKGTYSSSQLKSLLEDPEIFKKKYITGEIAKESNGAFDVGSYYHTAILEPHLLDKEFAIWEGRRAGKEYEAFVNKASLTEKTVLSDSQKEQAEILIKATKSSPIAMGRIKRGEAEVSAFSLIRIVGSDIYHPETKTVLGKYGWSKADSVPKKGIDLTVKVRADLLGDGFILDLKSTSGNTKDARAIKYKVADLSYDLSAAFYLDVFNSVHGGPYYTEFIWTFASKDKEIANCKNWKASEKMILVGRQKYIKALLALAEGLKTNWEVEDSMGILDPNSSDLDYITEKDEDLI